MPLHINVEPGDTIIVDAATTAPVFIKAATVASPTAVARVDLDANGGPPRSSPNLRAAAPAPDADPPGQALITYDEAGKATGANAALLVDWVTYSPKIQLGGIPEAVVLFQKFNTLVQFDLPLSSLSRALVLLIAVRGKDGVAWLGDWFADHLGVLAAPLNVFVDCVWAAYLDESKGKRLTWAGHNENRLGAFSGRRPLGGAYADGRCNRFRKKKTLVLSRFSWHSWRLEMARR